MFIIKANGLYYGPFSSSEHADYWASNNFPEWEEIPLVYFGYSHFDNV